MDVEMPSAKAVTAIRRNLADVRQHTVFEIVNVERARVFGLSPLRVVAPGYDEHGLVVGRRPDLMEVDALFEIVRLLHFIADTAVGLDPVDRDIGGEVISNEHVLAGIIDAGMDRPLPQFDEVAMER